MALPKFLGGGGGRAPQLPPTTGGPEDRVVCPACGKPNDFRTLKSEGLVDIGHRMTCDHCGNVMMVTGIRNVTVIQVRRYSGPDAGRRGDGAAAPASTLSPAQTRQLLQSGRRPRR